MIQLEIARTVATAVTPSPRVLETASMFGLGVDETHRIDIVPPTTITLPSSSVVFVTGPSGGRQVHRAFAHWGELPRAGGHGH